MKSLNLTGVTIAVLLTAPAIGPGGGLAKAQPPTPAFYEAASKIAPEGVLGQIVGQESISTPVAGAQAWRIAYISSDLAGRKTVVTGLVVAPVGSPPPEGR